jgi:hypothetical protein
MATASSDNREPGDIAFNVANAVHDMLTALFPGGPGQHWSPPALDYSGWEGTWVMEKALPGQVRRKVRVRTSGDVTREGFEINFYCFED